MHNKRPRSGLDLDSLREACKAAGVGHGFYPRKFLGYGIEGGVYSCKSSKLALKVGRVEAVWKAQASGLFNEVPVFPRVVHTVKNFITRENDDYQYYAIWREYCVVPRMDSAWDYGASEESKIIHEARMMMASCVAARDAKPSNTPRRFSDAPFKDYPPELVRFWNNMAEHLVKREDLGEYRWDMHNFNFGFVKRRVAGTRKFERHIVCFDPISG